MKTVTTILLFVLATSFALGQQDIDKRHQLFIGGEAGLNRTTVEGMLVDNHVSFDGRTRGKKRDRTGINASFVLKYEISRNFYIKSGLGYFEKGAYVESQLIQDFNAQVNYLNLPLLLGFGFPIDDRFNISAESGISANAKIGCKGEGCLDLEDTFSPGPGSGPKQLKTKNPLDFRAGLTVEFTLPQKNKLFISGRYFKDLTYFYGSSKDLRNYTANKPDADFSATHQGFAVSGGILFPMN